MSSLTLESIGLTPEEAQNRVIQTMVNRFLSGTSIDEDGNEVVITTRFKGQIQEAILSRVDETVKRLVGPVLDSSVEDYISKFKVNHTNAYGESKRQPETITEYIVRRAWEYLTEGVDSQGKSKSENGSSYDHRDKTTRVAYLIDKRLNDRIEEAMKEALKTANEAITAGLASAVKFELTKLNAKLKA